LEREEEEEQKNGKKKENGEKPGIEKEKKLKNLFSFFGTYR
jgi:hypothetical protein